MRAKKKILHSILAFLSIFLPFFPKKEKRITLVSLSMASLQGNFKCIAKQLSKYQDMEVYLLLTKYEKSLIGNFLYFINCIQQLFLINTSKVVILNDNNYVVSNFKTRYPIVIQVWHASGAIKKFGNEIQREYEIKNYDYVIAPSAIWKSVYAKSFHIPEERVLPLGLPSTDELLNKERMEQKKKHLYEKYPMLVGKYIVLYAPTFRGNMMQGMVHVDIDLEYVIQQLSKEYILLYKLHPLLSDVQLGHHKRILNVKEEDLYSLLAIADCLVSDYSSTLFDYLLLEKKQLYYVPDYEQYNREIGTNVDLWQMPGDICRKEDELIQALLQKDAFSLERVRRCKERYFTYSDGCATQRVVQFIAQVMQE